MAWHLGRTSTYEKVKTCPFWYMFNDVAAYLRQCERCQKQKTKTKICTENGTLQRYNISRRNEASRC